MLDLVDERAAVPRALDRARHLVLSVRVGVVGVVEGVFVVGGA